MPPQPPKMTATINLMESDDDDDEDYNPKSSEESDDDDDDYASEDEAAEDSDNASEEEAGDSENADADVDMLPPLEYGSSDSDKKKRMDSHQMTRHLTLARKRLKMEKPSRKRGASAMKAADDGDAQEDEPSGKKTKVTIRYSMCTFQLNCMHCALCGFILFDSIFS